MTKNPGLPIVHPPVGPAGGRSCGTCSVCCTACRIPSLNKPADTPCVHDVGGLPGGRCAVYADRPGPCKAFSCSWLDGWLADGQRPDESLVMLETCEIYAPRRLTVLQGSVARGVPEWWQEATATRFARAYDPPDGVILVIAYGPRASSPRRSTEGGVVVAGSEADCKTFQAWVEECQKRGGITAAYADGVREEIVL